MGEEGREKERALTGREEERGLVLGGGGEWRAGAGRWLVVPPSGCGGRSPRLPPQFLYLICPPISTKIGKEYVVILLTRRLQNKKN